jgi:gliding motility-associated-like protein
MLDSYLLYKALDTDNDGIADIIDIDQAGGLDSDNDGIIDPADVDQTTGVDINNDGIDDSYNIQLRSAAMADTSPLSVLVDLDKDDDGIADNVDVDQTGGSDSDSDGIDDFADVDQTGGIDLNGDGVDDSIIANPNPTSTPYTDTIDLIPGSYAIELVYSDPDSGDCIYTEDNNMFTILNDGLLIETNLDELVCYGTDDASISVNISKLEPSTFYSVNWIRLDPVTNTPDGYEKVQVFSTTENHDSSYEPKMLSASNLVSGKYRVEVWQNDDPSCRYEFENMQIKSIKPVQIVSQKLDEVASINGTFATFSDGFDNQFEYSIDSDGDGIADNSDGGFVIPPSCDEFVNDGEIKVQILGNEYLNKEIKWYSYQLGDNCLTYFIEAIDLDLDGVADYADSDIDADNIPNLADIDQTSGSSDKDGDGIIDAADIDETGGLDVNNDGIDDSFNTEDDDLDGILNDFDLDPNDNNVTTVKSDDSLGIVTYQNCATDFININLTHQISQTGGITICAKPGQVVMDVNASAFFTLSGGTQSCSLSSWVELPDFEGINYLKNLDAGKYKVVVTEIDPEDPQRNCQYEKEIELFRDAVKYENVRIDENICLGETGIVTIDLIRFDGDPIFYYEGVEVAATKLQSNNNTIEISSYEITISPVENGLLLVSNSEGCNTTIDPSLIYNEFSDPEFTYTSESFQLYNVIPKNELVRFEVTSNIKNYTSIEWDFGDVTSIEYGDKVFHSYSADGIYDVKLTVFNDAGCSKEIITQIIIGDGYLLMVPNVFTPNNDGKNDVFVPKFSGFINISMRIYNAYGNLLHESAENGGDDGNGNIIKPQITPWDGSNADLNSKMYIYHINGVIINGEVIEKTGTIQILR